MKSALLGRRCASAAGAFLLGLLACCAGSGPAASTTAQQLVESIAGKHKDVVRLTVHAVPSGGSQLQAVASTSADKRGKPSDPEDLRAMQTGEEVVLQEGDNLDVTLPMTDAAGKRVGISGVTLRSGAGRSRAQLIADARAITQELNDVIRKAKQPLW